MYSTYQQYQQRGGQLPEKEYLANAQKACEMIDYYTMGQAAAAETMQSQLSACECDLVDIMKNIQASFCGISSENNDGFSQSFTDSANMQTNVVEILKRHLTFPTNLLSIAGNAFV